MYVLMYSLKFPLSVVFSISGNLKSHFQIDSQRIQSLYASCMCWTDRCGDQPTINKYYGMRPDKTLPLHFAILRQRHWGSIESAALGVRHALISSSNKFIRRTS